MSRLAIEQVIYTMSEAFEGNDEHSLLANLRSLMAEDWNWIPPGAKRSIFAIVQHIGECKYVYENHAFGDASIRWDRPGSVPSVDLGDAPAVIIDWLRDGQQRLMRSAASLEHDRELLTPRPASWGSLHETRWLLNVMLQHDLYHGGEINHIRALRQRNDQWAFLTEEGELQ